MELDRVTKLTLEELKLILKKMGLGTDGKKEVLISSLFSAFENGLPDVPSEQEKGEVKKLTYKKLLNLGQDQYFLEREGG